MGYDKHETAVVENVKIGDGTKIWHFAHIRTGAKIGKDCNIGKGVYIDTNVKIGDKTKIQNFVSIYAGATLKEDVFIGPSVTFTNDLYPRSNRWNEEDIVSTLVEKGVSIGANSTIVCGIKIGKHALIGAGSVVTKDVPSFGLMFGNPARLQGFVCYCGKKLNDVLTEDEKKTAYKCSRCGRTIEIGKK